MALTRSQAEALDAEDPLRDFRARFVIADEHRLYLDGNSLGRLPKGTRERLHRVIDQWGEELVGGWHEWIDAPARAGDALAEVLGARSGQVLVTDSTTVNLYKLVNALLDADPSLRTLATEAGNFPTDRYVLEGIARVRGLRLELFESLDDLPRGALAVVSHVDYRTGAVADMEAIDPLATVVWDLSHSAGALPVELEARGIRFAVGCTYKYLNAGPGAAGYLYVREPDVLRSPIQGWFGQAEQFAMERPYAPAPGIARFLAGTPPILVLAAVEEGARITAEAGIEALRSKSVAQTELMIALGDEWLAPLGFTLGSPREPHRRGSHVAFRHPEAWPICRALIERADVVPDFRDPDIVRLGVAPLYTRYVDVYDALERLRDLVAAGVQRDVDQARARVT